MKFKGQEKKIEKSSAVRNYRRKFKEKYVEICHAYGSLKEIDKSKELGCIVKQLKKRKSIIHAGDIK